MKFRFSGKPLLAVSMSAAVLAGCVSSAAIVPQPRAQQPAAVRGPAGAVTVPIGQPVRSQMPRPAGPLDPGFRRAPAGLNDRIYELWRAFPGKTGIAVQRIDGEWSLSQRGAELFPQQSVSKLWVALTVLDAVDQGRLTMDQRVRIGPEDLTWSLISRSRRACAAEGFGHDDRAQISSRPRSRTATITANDSLLRTVGGPAAVRAFIAKKDSRLDPFRPRRAPMLQAGPPG
jgi:beta-lactamase class A